MINWMQQLSNLKIFLSNFRELNDPGQDDADLNWNCFTLWRHSWDNLFYENPYFEKKNQQLDDKKHAKLPSMHSYTLGKDARQLWHMDIGNAPVTGKIKTRDSKSK